MMVVAVTGGIGSGKTTVVDLFRKQGVPVIDTDVISRQLVEPGKPALSSIISVFGEKFVDSDGTLNRSALRETIFSDEKQRKQLETILHPLIYQSVLKKLKEIDTPYCLLVIPLLIESKQEYPHDRILVIDIDRQTQIERASERDELPASVIEKIIDSQATREQRLARATDIIDNNKGMSDLILQVNKLHDQYQALAVSRQ